MGEAMVLRSGGGAEKPPEKWRFLQAITGNSSFVMEKKKWYRIHVFGKSEDGIQTVGTGAVWAFYPGGRGGNSGGYSQSVLMEKKDTTVSCTVNQSITSFGSYLSATCGNSSGVGKGSGGNQANAMGYLGGAGGAGKQGVAAAGSRGGNNGGYGGGVYSNEECASMVYSGGYCYSGGGGGGGGARLPESPYTGTMGTIGAGGKGGCVARGKDDEGDTQYRAALPSSGNTPPTLGSSNLPIVYGGGGGGGGVATFNAWKNGGAGGIGTPGIIIIEVGADN